VCGSVTCASHSSEEEPCGDIFDHHELQSIEGAASSSGDEVSENAVAFSI